MKKYDIALVLLYILLVGSAYACVRYGYHKEQQLRMVYKEVVDNQDIDSIVIENVESKLEIFYAKEGDDRNWKLRGWLNQNHLESLFIEDGVLHIQNLEKGKLAAMKVNRDIAIEIINSPRVEILSDEELAIRKNQEYNKWRYEF